MTASIRQFLASTTVKVAIGQAVAGLVALVAAVVLEDMTAAAVGLALILKSAVDVWARAHVDDEVEGFLTDRTVQLALAQALISSGLWSSLHDPTARKVALVGIGKSVFDIWKRYRTTDALADKPVKADPPAARPGHD